MSVDRSPASEAEPDACTPYGSILHRPLPEAAPPDALYARALALSLGERDRETKSSWRLDRTLGPSVVLSLLGMLAGGCTYIYTAVSWAQTMTVQLEAAKGDTTRLAVALEQGDKRILDRGDERFRTITLRLEGLERDRAGDRERLVKVEEQFRWVADALGRIERKLDGRPR